MTSNELATVDQQSDLAAQMDYARAVSEGSLLPADYRGKPANVLIAIGLGQSMGLTPAESLYRIDVIQGKPSASAELIAANVRKAGHRLRLEVDEANVSATCTIIRADDPYYPHVVTRNREWAQQMGLLGKDNYKKQPATMLGWRAVTACARQACPEALYGVAHSTDELMDAMPAPSAPQGQQDAPASERMAGILGTPAQTQSDEPHMLNTSSGLAKRMFASLGDIGISSKADRLKYVGEVIGREVTSSAEMTEADAEKVIAAVESDQTAIDVTDAKGVETLPEPEGWQ